MAQENFENDGQVIIIFLEQMTSQYTCDKLIKLRALSICSLKCLLTEECIKKMWYIYTMEYYSTIKWNETVQFETMQ